MNRLAYIKQWSFFIETHAAIDEWLGDVIGLFWFEKCILGLFLYDIGHSRQFGIVFWNIGIGIWRDEEKGK